MGALKSMSPFLKIVMFVNVKGTKSSLCLSDAGMLFISVVSV